MGLETTKSLWIPGSSWHRIPSRDTLLKNSTATDILATIKTLQSFKNGPLNEEAK